MARCTEWPCCGHESGCCPDYDENGQQLNMKCVCGATVPVGAPTSLCEFCLDPAGTIARRRIERSNVGHETCEACFAPQELDKRGDCGGCHLPVGDCECEWCSDCERCFKHCVCVDDCDAFDDYAAYLFGDYYDADGYDTHSD